MKATLKATCIKCLQKFETDKIDLYNICPKCKSPEIPDCFKRMFNL